MKCLCNKKNRKNIPTLTVYEIALLANLFCANMLLLLYNRWNDVPAAVKCYYIRIIVAKEDRIRFSI